MTGIEVRTVRRYAVECRVDDCCWDQEHVTRADAEADGARHLADWHATEANLAAVKAKQA